MIRRSWRVANERAGKARRQAPDPAATNERVGRRGKGVGEGARARSKVGASCVATTRGGVCDGEAVVNSGGSRAVLVGGFDKASREDIL
jgi:hypothetical protein